MADLESNILTVSYMNIHGQTKLPTVKQLQIQDFIKYKNIDILHLQEIEIDENTFSECDYISSYFNIISNNSVNKYGTASIIRSDLDYRNIRCDTSGRAIMFDIGAVTFGNVYGHLALMACQELTEKLSLLKLFQIFSSTINFMAA